MNTQEAGALVHEWSLRLAKLRAEREQATSTRRDHSELSDRDVLSQAVNAEQLPMDIALGFQAAIAVAQPEQLNKIARMIEERGRQWTPEKRPRGPLNRVKRRSA